MLLPKPGIDFHIQSSSHSSRNKTYSKEYRLNHYITSITNTTIVWLSLEISSLLHLFSFEKTYLHGIIITPKKVCISYPFTNGMSIIPCIGMLTVTCSFIQFLVWKSYFRFYCEDYIFKIVHSANRLGNYYLTTNVTIPAGRHSNMTTVHPQKTLLHHESDELHYQLES